MKPKSQLSKILLLLGAGILAYSLFKKKNPVKVTENVVKKVPGNKIVPLY